VGEKFTEAIQTQIDKCAAFVVVLSPESLASKWVQRRSPMPSTVTSFVDRLRTLTGATAQPTSPASDPEPSLFTVDKRQLGATNPPTARSGISKVYAVGSKVSGLPSPLVYKEVTTVTLAGVEVERRQVLRQMRRMVEVRAMTVHGEGFQFAVAVRSARSPVGWPRSDRGMQCGDRPRIGLEAMAMPTTMGLTTGGRRRPGHATPAGAGRLTRVRDRG
jgi:hypothetical protein